MSPAAWQCWKVLVLLGAFAAPGWAEDPPSRVANNPATDVLNQAADAAAVVAPHAVLGTLMREHPRISEIIGVRLHGAQNEVLGQIEDVVLREEGAIAIVQVGRLMGQLAAVTLADIRWDGERLVVPGLTAEGLRARPPFQFAAPRVTAPRAR